MHDPECILPQCLARTLGKEDIDARLTLPVRADGRGGGRSGAHSGGAAARNFLRLVNAAIVENILEGIMMMFDVVIVGAVNGARGGLITAVAVVVSVKVIRKPGRNNSGENEKKCKTQSFT